MSFDVVSFALGKKAKKRADDAYDKILIGTSTEKPPAGVRGRIYIATDEEIAYYDNGSSWIPLGAVLK